MCDHLGEREEIWLESLDFCHMPSALLCIDSRPWCLQSVLILMWCSFLQQAGFLGWAGSTKFKLQLAWFISGPLGS